MKNIVFLAPPLSGKGTQSKLLVDKYNYTHISTGDLLRKLNDEKFKDLMNNGSNISDDVIMKLLEDELISLDNGLYILDGAPRSLEQAIKIDEILKRIYLDNYVVIVLDVDKEILLDRIKNRVVCSCGRSYNLVNEQFKPKVDNVCDSCGSMLSRRDDDKIEALENRLNSYDIYSKEIIEYYNNTDKVYHIDGSLDYEDIFKGIEEIVND